jgi:hypothetical protein
MFVFTYYGKCQELSKIVEIGKCQILSILGKIGNCQILSNFGKNWREVGYLTNSERQLMRQRSVDFTTKLLICQEKIFDKKMETVSSFQFPNYDILISSTCFLKYSFAASYVLNPPQLS